MAEAIEAWRLGDQKAYVVSSGAAPQGCAVVAGQGEDTVRIDVPLLRAGEVEEA